MSKQKWTLPPQDVLAGRTGKPKSASDLRKDLDKWSAPSEAQDVISLVYTAQPKRYDQCDNKIIIRRTLPSRPAVAASIEATSNALHAYEEAKTAMFAAFKEEPFRFLREKDFETYLFTRMREAVQVNPNELHPVHTQWWSEWANLMGRKRRQDLVVQEPNREILALEIELKTSHSDQHNWFRTKALEGEFDAMQRLVKQNKLKRAIFLMYRFGPKKWETDAESVCSRFLNVSLDCRCSD